MTTMLDRSTPDDSVEKPPESREQRRALRLTLEPGEAFLESRDLFGVELVDVSVSGVGLVVPPEFDHHHRELGGVLRFGNRHAAVRLKPIRIATNSAVPRVGACFIDPSHQTLREIGNFLVDRFVSRERQLNHLWEAREKTLRFRSGAFVTELLRRRAIEEATPIHVYRDRIPLDLRLFAWCIEQTSGASVLKAIPDRQVTHVLKEGDRCDFVMAGKMAASIFSASIIDIAQDGVVIEVPSEIRQSGFRMSGRKRLSSAEPISIMASYSPGRDTNISGQLLDVSVGGFSFFLSGDREPLLPGESIPALTVELPFGNLTASAMVRRVAPHIHGGGREYGIQIVDFAHPDDSKAWKQFVFERLHPRTIANDSSIVQASWDLLGTSEYLQLWTPDALRDHLKASFMKSWSSVDADCGHLTLLREERRDIGTLAASRICPQTWLLHSLGVDKERRDRTRFFFNVARDIYDALLHLVQQSSNSKYFVLYAEKAKRWTKLLYSDFVEAYSDDAAMLFDEYRLFRHRTDTEMQIPQHVSTLSFEVLHGKQLRRIAKNIESKTTPLEQEAFAYSENEIDLTSFGDSSGRIGSDRSRSAITAQVGTELVAVLLADIGDEGANVFGLLNRCRIIWLRETSERDEIKRALLARAAALYKGAGKLAFLFLDRDVRADDIAADLGYEFVSDGIRWLARIDIMPAWRSFIDDIMGVQGADSGGVQQRGSGGNILNAIPTESRHSTASLEQL